MDLELSPDQRELASIAQQLLDRRAPLSLARDHLDGHGDPSALWSAVAEVGWYAVGIDEDDPFGLPGLCLLARAWGGHVAAGPLVDTAVALRLAGLLDAAAAGGAVAALLAGEAVGALAVLEEGADWSLAGISASARRDGDDVVLDGVKLAVPHAGRADVLAVVAELDGDLAVAFVEPGADGVTVEPEAGIDPATAPALVALTGVRVPASQVVADVNGAGALDRLLAIGAVATAAEGAGAASRALDLAVEYAQEREQFGRPIARFQALQHVMADAHVLRETAWSTILYAAAALEEDMPDALEAAAIAKAHASRASRSVVEAALQVFGGVAFTWEHDVHLFQRRVLECERRFGDAIHHERILADRFVLAPTEVRS
jgi:alkylation response protein AidB-like acyl-CoA dehydrogenase